VLTYGDSAFLVANSGFFEGNGEAGLVVHGVFLCSVSFTRYISVQLFISASLPWGRRWRDLGAELVASRDIKYFLIWLT
jgi:hypothetical protein